VSIHRVRFDPKGAESLADWLVYATRDSARENRSEIIGKAIVEVYDKDGVPHPCRVEILACGHWVYPLTHEANARQCHACARFRTLLTYRGASAVHYFSDRDPSGSFWSIQPTLVQLDAARATREGEP